LISHGAAAGEAAVTSAVEDRAAAEGRGRDADVPEAIPGRGWRDILRRVWRALGRDHIWVAAAGLAFCALFAAIPGFAVVVAAFGLVADPAAVRGQLEATGGLLPAEAGGFLAGQVQAIAAAPRFHLGGALLVALWAARTGASTLVSVLNIACRERERRGPVRYHLTVLAVTATVCLFGLAALATVAVLPLVAGALPLSPRVGTAVSLGRWPALAVLMVLALAAVYRFGPCRRRPRWRWVAPGAVAATALWLASSAGFSAYVARFGSYGETFGVLGTVMLLMSWFYLTAFAVLLGAELNAEVERQTARDTTEGPARPLGRRGARMADVVGEEDERRGGHR
jgi:membrane protein